MIDRNVILTDCDGVLLDWEYAFDVWMASQGYRLQDDHKMYYNIDIRYNLEHDVKERLVREFNESANIGFIPSLRDSIYYIRKLHYKHGYVFHVITSLSSNRYAQSLRISNLKKLFGKTVFDRFTFLDTGADKDQALLEYKDSSCIWVEDSIRNAEVGVSLGLRSYLMEHGHNMHSSVAPRIKNWRELYNIIT